MLFNSYEFIYIFLPIIYVIYRVTAKYGPSKSQCLLCLASVIFYSFVSLEYLPLMLFTIVTNYLIGLKTYKNKNRLMLGIIFNLSVLWFFKYFDLIAVETLGFSQTLRNTIIPLGISFYIFTQIAYLVDAYRGETASDNSFVSYFLFVSYFPHLIAGPVLHHREMIEQFQVKNNYMMNYKNLIRGSIFFIVGLSKKVLIADNLIPYTSPVFKAVSIDEFVSPLECWCGAVAYAFQLYFDFSGYSDMAIGISSFFNFNLPINFNSPYKATSIIDFWRRWHISLSEFLKNYLYIPLGGNRKGNGRRYFNVLLTMVLGGIWHGANWTFVVWGGYHGILLSLNHLTVSITTMTYIPKAIKFVVTFFLVVMGWIVFRSKNIESALKYYSYMFDFPNYLMVPQGWAPLVEKLPMKVGTLQMPNFLGKSEIIFLLFVGFICLCFPNSQKLFSKYTNNLSKSFVIFIMLVFLLVSCLYQIDERSEFIYFQF